MRHHIFAAAGVLLMCSGWALADVADSSANGFTVKTSITIQAPPDEVYHKVVHNVGEWWNPEHTYSGDSHNLTIEEKPMGCFCEKLPNQGGVRHLELVYFTPGKALVFSGALGPLQSLAATGSMTIQFSPAEGGTRLGVAYTVAGYVAGGMNTWAAPVDSVITEQFMRLKTYVEHGSAALQTKTTSAAPFPVTQGKAYKFEKVAEGVYYATGGVGSNNVVIVNDQDVLLVDDGTTPATARALVEDIKLLTDKPVRTVVNTHFHYDHTFGNQVFGPEVEIIGHEYLRNAMLNFDVLHREPYLTSMGTLATRIAGLQKQIADEKDVSRKASLGKDLTAAESLREQLKEVKVTAPGRTYATKLILHKGSREIQLLFLGRGHTGGDTFVYLPQERIVCTGDMDEGARVAYMGDGVFDEWIASLDELKKLDFQLVLPGHGVPFRDKTVITAFQSYLSDITSQAAALRKQGVSAEDAAKRVDLTSHKKDFPDIQGPGAEPRGVRRIYQWMDERDKR